MFKTVVLEISADCTAWHCPHRLLRVLNLNKQSRHALSFESQISAVFNVYIGFYSMPVVPLDRVTRDAWLHDRAYAGAITEKTMARASDAYNRRHHSVIKHIK